MRQLTGPEIKILSEAINESFDLDDFTTFLLYRLNKRFDNLTKPATFPTQIRQVIEKANKEYWHDELIDAFLSERTQYPEVRALAYELNITASFVQGSGTNVLDRGGLEALVRNVSHASMSEFSERVQLIERTVCSICFRTTTEVAYGTGFLVGPDLLLSNYHVFEKLILEPQSVVKVSCLFDYKSTNSGLEVLIATENPILAYSPISLSEDADLNSNWPDDELDYALVRLEKKIGLESFGLSKTGDALPDAPKRRWIKFEPNILVVPPKESNLFIAQHPNGKPMKFNIGKLLGIAANQNRIRYDVNTEKGSSGSPCFDEKLNWVALHNFGDPSYWTPPDYNQGIPAYKIVAHMKTKGFDLLEQQKVYETL